jgi:hypothetical protein
MRNANCKIFEAKVLPAQATTFASSPFAFFISHFAFHNWTLPVLSPSFSDGTPMRSSNVRNRFVIGVSG